MSKADGLKITLALDLCKLSWFSFIFLEVQLCACAGCAKSPQLCPTLCDPMGWALQAPLPMGFSRWEYCVILVFLRKIQTSLVSFGGAPVTLIRQPEVAHSCHQGVLWFHESELTLRRSWRASLFCLCCCLATTGFSLWLFTITWVTARGPKLFSLCVLPSFPAHWCPRVNEGARASRWLVSRVPACPRRALCGEALGFCHHSHYFAK